LVGDVAQERPGKLEEQRGTRVKQRLKKPPEGRGKSGGPRKAKNRKPSRHTGGKKKKNFGAAHYRCRRNKKGQ